MLPVKSRIICTVMLLVSFAALTFAGVPSTINYQGYVRDSATSAPLNATVPMTFSLYSSARPGSGAVWNETHSNVSVSNGIFSVQLGTASPGQTIDIPFNTPYWLGVNVNSAGELPLQPLSSVPYALRAQVADAVGLACPDNSVLVYRGTWQCGGVTTMPNAAGVCAGGTCAVSACSQGFGNCDGQALNGCEINHSNDVNNCGGCGTVCTQPANATVSCSSSLCSAPVCTAGWGSCDNQAANGCEINLLSTVGNCGACGNVCSFPHALAACLNGGCSIGSCDTGYYNVDGIAANGCEYQCTPTGLEICDGIDNDCDGIVDNANTQLNPQYHWYNDMDGDTYAASSGGFYACAPPAGYSNFVCSGNNCTITYSGQLKNPGGSPYMGAATLNFVLYPSGFHQTVYWQETREVTVTNGVFTLDLGAVTPLSRSLFSSETIFDLAIGFYGSTIHQFAPFGLFINETMSAGTDCDDSDPAIKPGMPEICDDRDNNCDGQTDEGFDLNSDQNNCGFCGNVCDPGMTCESATCQGSLTCGNCDDGIACTIDSCNTGTGTCVHTPNNGACSDVDICNGTETCSAAVGCVSGTPISCDDANPCTLDTCVSLMGCQFLNMDDGTECGSGLTCQGGTCQP